MGKGKMSLTAYTDGSFSKVHEAALELPVNPAKVKLGKGINYAEDRQLGSLNGSNVFVRYKPETLSFECLLDMTNAMDDDDEKMSVRNMAGEIEARLYDYNEDGHRPSFVKVEYGDITFFGQLKTLDAEYTLFDTDGSPLRATLQITLTGYCSHSEELKHFPKRSPDVSRLVTLKQGQTLSSLCYEVYGDAQLVGQVARCNNLNGFRNIPAGMEIMLPMLKK